MTDFVDSFVSTLEKAKKDAQETLSLHEPRFDGNEYDYIKECLDTRFVSSVGKFVNTFEEVLADYTGAKHAIVTVNGTSALHALYLAAGVDSETEVLVPSLTFVATCNAIQYCGGTPHFIDSEESYLGIDVNKLDSYLSENTEQQNNVCINRVTKKKIKALCVMHTFGHPVDLDPIKSLCDKYHLLLLEDAAEALGSYYKRQHVGHYGFGGALSFNGNKIITTGGGGAILTNDAKLAKRLKHQTTTAKKPHPYCYEHDMIGFNYRLPNINAALGVAQLETLPKYLEKKRKLSLAYKELLGGYDAWRFVEEPPFAKSNLWLNAIILNEGYACHREEILGRANAKNILVRPVWELMHTLPMFSSCPRMDLQTAESLAKRIINIPSSPFLEERVCG